VEAQRVVTEKEAVALNQAGNANDF